MAECSHEHCLLSEHTGRHWYGSPQRVPRPLDELDAVRDLQKIVRREAIKLAADGVWLPGRARPA